LHEHLDCHRFNFHPPAKVCTAGLRVSSGLSEALEVGDERRRIGRGSKQGRKGRSISTSGWSTVGTPHDVRVGRGSVFRERNSDATDLNAVLANPNCEAANPDFRTPNLNFEMCDLNFETTFRWPCPILRRSPASLGHSQIKFQLTHGTPRLIVLCRARRSQITLLPGGREYSGTARSFHHGSRRCSINPSPAHGRCAS